MPELPKTIYVIYDDGDLLVYDTLEECVDDDNESALVGKYELVQEKKYKRIVTEA